MKRFDGKVVLVTGGRSGIGKAISQRFASEGARVFTAQRGKEEEFEGITCDLGDSKICHRVIDEVIQQAGRLDVLVNNAGMMIEANLQDMSVEQWQRTLAVNLTAPFVLIKAALVHLSKSKGAVINIGSIEGLGSNPLHAAYCASKAGLHGLTRAVAVDHGSDGIRCNAIAPGWIDTELNNDFVANQADPDAFVKGLGSIHPVGRSGTPEEVAALAAFLASEESAFISGQVYTIDGGRMTKLSLPNSN